MYQNSSACFTNVWSWINLRNRILKLNLSKYLPSKLQTKFKFSCHSEKKYLFLFDCLSLPKSSEPTQIARLLLLFHVLRALEFQSWKKHRRHVVQAGEKHFLEPHSVCRSCCLKSKTCHIIARSDIYGQIFKLNFSFSLPDRHDQILMKITFVESHFWFIIA